MPLNLFELFTPSAASFRVPSSPSFKTPNVPVFRPGDRVLISWSPSIRQRYQFFTRVYAKQSQQLALHLPLDEPSTDSLAVGCELTVVTVGGERSERVEMILQAVSLLSPPLLIVEPGIRRIQRTLRLG